MPLKTYLASAGSGPAIPLEEQLAEARYNLRRIVFEMHETAEAGHKNFQLLLQKMSRLDAAIKAYEVELAVDWAAE